MLENDLIIKIKNQAIDVTFEEVMQVINDNYLYTPTSFVNGVLDNQASTN